MKLSDNQKELLIELKIVFIILSVALVGIILIIRLLGYGLFEKPREELRSKIRIGMTEEEIKNVLGKPDKIYFKETAPKDYYDYGWAYKERAISNKVFIYRLGEPIAYVYFDETNRVEDVFVGGS